MPEDTQLQIKESRKARDVFLVYFALGANRSLQKVHQELTKVTPEKTVGIRTLKEWSGKYKWVERVRAMDQEVADRAEESAIQEASVKKSEVLKMIKNTMIKYNQALLEGSVVPTVSDFKKVWEMHRIEQGKPMIIQEGGAPESFMKIEINQRILQIVKKAEDEMREELRKELND